jgi:hypothetical protein
LSQLMDLPLTEQSEDDSQWQSVNDTVGQLPVDQTGLSFSDAETQFPIHGECFSDAETRWSTECTCSFPTLMIPFGLGKWFFR